MFDKVKTIKEGFCPLCAVNNIKSEIQTYQINFHEAIFMCVSQECSWPMEAYEDELLLFNREVKRPDSWTAYQWNRQQELDYLKQWEYKPLYSCSNNGKIETFIEGSIYPEEQIAELKSGSISNMLEPIESFYDSNMSCDINVSTTLDSKVNLKPTLVDIKPLTIKIEKLPSKNNISKKKQSANNISKINKQVTFKSKDVGTSLDVNLPSKSRLRKRKNTILKKFSFEELKNEKEQLKIKKENNLQAPKVEISETKGVVLKEEKLNNGSQVPKVENLEKYSIELPVVKEDYDDDYLDFKQFFDSSEGNAHNSVGSNKNNDTISINSVNISKCDFDSTITSVSKDSGVEQDTLDCDFEFDSEFTNYLSQELNGSFKTDESQHDYEWAY